LVFSPKRSSSFISEDTADQEHQVFAGKRFAEQINQRLFECQDHGNTQQHDDTHHHADHQSVAPSALLVFFGQFARKDADEDDVVDAEDYFE